MSLGRLLGGAAGFLIGGPAGAALGMGLGGAAEEALGGGQSGAIRDAASMQAAAADRAAQLQREMFERQVQLSEPWRQSGIAAQNQLLTLLGIAPQGATPSTGGGKGGGGILGGIAGAVADQIAKSGAAGPQLRVDTTSPEFGKYAKEFGMAQFQADPGYAFRLAEGQKALERSAAARGGLLSGGTGKALQRYGQEMGSQEYTNAFDRYQAERAARLNPLQSLAGVGQTTANQLGAAGRNYGASVGDLYTQQGETAANALLASQRARGSAYGQLGSALGGFLGAPNMGSSAPSIGYQDPYAAFRYGSSA